MQKNKILIISVSVIILIIIGGGIFYYYKYTLPEKKFEENLKIMPQLSDEELSEKLGHPENYYQFSGQITGINLADKTMVIKVDRVINFTEDRTADYKKDVYNFSFDEKTKFTQMTFEKAGSGGFSDKTISINDLKINDQVSLMVPIGEINKKDNFLIKSVVLLVFK